MLLHNWMRGQLFIPGYRVLELGSLIFNEQVMIKEHLEAETEFDDEHEAQIAATTEQDLILSSQLDILKCNTLEEVIKTAIGISLVGNVKLKQLGKELRDGSYGVNKLV